MKELQWCTNGAIFHASTSLFERLDSVQRGFLHELDISPDAAFDEYNFAPPNLRRDIGVLGLMHKRVLGIAHPIYAIFFSANIAMVPRQNILTTTRSNNGKRNMRIRTKMLWEIVGTRAGLAH